MFDFSLGANRGDYHRLGIACFTFYWDIVQEKSAQPKRWDFSPKAELKASNEWFRQAVVVCTDPYLPRVVDYGELVIHKLHHWLYLLVAQRYPFPLLGASLPCFFTIGATGVWLEYSQLPVFRIRGGD